MLFIHLFFTSLIFADCLLPAPLSNCIPKKCVTLTRADIREKLGKPVKCLNDSKDTECFEHEREPIRVLFNSSDVVTSIEISTVCNGLHSLIKALNEIVPKENRGKYRQQFERSPAGSCQRVYEEEYECVRIRYWQENCMGCAPASIKVIWNQSTSSQGRSYFLSAIECAVFFRTPLAS